MLCLDLTFNLHLEKEATNMDDGATLTCRASIGFPPFSMLSLIKNGQTVATSTSGLLQMDSKSVVKRNPFGLYICQLNASGVTFQKSSVLKEQGAVITIVYTTEFRVNGGICCSYLATEDDIQCGKSRRLQ